MSLTSTQKRYLRGLTHALKPVVSIGNKGVTAALRAEFAVALEHHELIKVKLTGDDRESRKAQIDALTRDAELVQTIGKVAAFYKRNADAPKLALPK